MSTRAAAWVAWSCCGLSQALAALGLVFLLQNLSHPTEHILDYWVDVAVMAVAFSTVGAIIASRHPGNLIGWIFCAIGVLGGLRSLTVQYAIYGFVARSGSLPGGEALALTFPWNWVPYVALLVLLGLLFPDGRLPGRRWRPFAWLTAATASVAIIALAVSPEPLWALGGALRNPLGVEGLDSGAVWIVTQACMYSLALVSAASLVVRLRRSSGTRRQQLKWVVAAGALAAAGAMSNRVLYPLLDSAWVSWVTFVPMIAGLASIPIAMGIAIFKHHLYDIDRIINRTLVYGPLTALLALVYVGSAVGLQSVFRALSGQESTLAIVASTLAIAALFSPLRRTVQGFVDRRFYRRKYDAAKTLEAFSTKLRDETDLHTLSDDLVGAVRETMQPTHLSLWLRPETVLDGEQAD
jgi:hypothetical protein